MPESLRIVVPSRARSHNMKRLLKLIPTALVCVAISEKEVYSKVVPANQLLFHDDIKGLVNIRNWINTKIQEDCVVMSDDDLLCVRPLIGKQRPITNPAVILQIINNSHVVCQDLGINVFCWSRTRNSFLAGPDGNPIRLVQPMAATWGLRGAARERKFDTTLPARPDLDFTMKTLLKDRILYADMRFYFDQPILVGHHSERHHRRALDKHDNAMRCGCESQDMAAHHISKAGGLAHQLARSVFSDDVDAVEQLTEKIAEAENLQEVMRAVNAIVRRKPKNESTPEKVVELLALGLKEGQVAKLFTPDFMGRHASLQGPQYHLSRMHSHYCGKSHLELLREWIGQPDNDALPALSRFCVHGTRTTHRLAGIGNGRGRPGFG